MTYTEALSAVQSDLAWLGWLHVGLAGLQIGGMVAGWVWLREAVAALRAQHAGLERELRHPTLDARALTEAMVALDEAVSEIRQARGESRDLVEVARLVAGAAGVDAVSASGGAGVRLDREATGAGGRRSRPSRS